MIDCVANGGGPVSEIVEAAPAPSIPTIAATRRSNSPQQHQQQQGLMLGSGDLCDDHDVKAPKKRAETWAQEEIRALIAHRREMDSLFNTSKSNKHLWDLISSKMKERGFDRSPTMCIDKWRNLLKEYKKARHHDKNGGGGSANKVGCFKELEDLLSERARLNPYKSPSKLDTSPKVTTTSRNQFNLESRLESEANHHLSSSNDLAVANGWNWKEAGGAQRSSLPAGKIITIRYNSVTRRVGIDGSPDSIREAIKAAFRLRTKRAFWLEDEDGVVWSIDRDMPLGSYILNLDEGVTIKVCLYDESDRLTGATEDKTLFTEDNFKDFLARRGWTGVRQVGGFQDVEFLHELHPLCVYQRAGLLGA
ncbi:trihelix transcription factor GT-1 [Selaginella moellendorffii]|uniref:trihelix transcription factor GT-1 n=1 Tax=Selaginella moellendorffii TaxID=88036 RepID=UPI000D1C324A|nr:trihelix transcription factor GT-1 [Selaginella moellendorffii]|eukprot:XP_024539329.1 trihelix transcription factor GT-1 [Selaginella moellendorffii]